jgi:hypothetical protein
MLDILQEGVVIWGQVETIGVVQEYSESPGKANLNQEVCPGINQVSPEKCCHEIRFIMDLGKIVAQPVLAQILFN